MPLRRLARDLEDGRAHFGREVLPRQRSHQATAQWMGSAASLHAGDAVTVWYDGVPFRGTVTSATPFVQVSLQPQLITWTTGVGWTKPQLATWTTGVGWTKTLTPLDRWLHGWYADSDYEVAKRTAPLTTTIEQLRRGPHEDSGTPAAARRHNSQAARAQEQLLVQLHVRRGLQRTQQPTRPLGSIAAWMLRRLPCKAADSTACAYRLCLPACAYRLCLPSRRLRCRSSRRCPCPPAVRGGRRPPSTSATVGRRLPPAAGSMWTCGSTRWQGVSGCW